MSEAVQERHERDDPFPDLSSMQVALDAGEVGVWAWDIKPNSMRWSANLESIHELSTNGIQNTFARFQRAFILRISPR